MVRVEEPAELEVVVERVDAVAALNGQDTAVVVHDRGDAQAVPQCRATRIRQPQEEELRRLGQSVANDRNHDGRDVVPAGQRQDPRLGGEVGARQRGAFFRRVCHRDGMRGCSRQGDGEDRVAGGSVALEDLRVAHRD